MVMDQKEYEQIKEEYKTHYRKVKELRKRLTELKRSERVSSAMEQMNTDDLLNSFDNVLQSFKEKVAIAEARLSVALDNILPDNKTEQQPVKESTEEEKEEVVRKQKARETLNMLKNEMGMLHMEIEEKARELNATKTIGSDERDQSAEFDRESTSVKRGKTIGRDKKDKEHK